MQAVESQSPTCQYWFYACDFEEVIFSLHLHISIIIYLVLWIPSDQFAFTALERQWIHFLSDWHIEAREHYGVSRAAHSLFWCIVTVNAIGTKQTQRKCGQKQTCTNTGFKHGNTDARNAKQRGMNAESKTANGNLIRHPKRGKIYSPKGKTHMQRNAKGRRNNALK